MTLNYVALTITVQDAGEDAGTGSVLVAPTGAVTAAGVTVVSPAPVSRSLSNGAVTINLVATDNESTVPAAAFWAYQITLPGQTPQLYLVDFADGASQRLDNLTPVVAETTYGPAAAGGAVSSVFGRTGTVTAQSGDYTAAQVGADASGAAAAAQSAAEAASVAKDGDTMTGHLAPKVVTLTDAATIVVDVSLGNDFRVTLAGNRNMGVPANPVDGQDVTFLLTQDGTGSRTVTWASGSGGYSFGGGSAPTLSTAAAATDLVAFKYRAAAQKWLCLGSATGF